MVKAGGSFMWLAKLGKKITKIRQIRQGNSIWKNLE